MKLREFVTDAKIAENFKGREDLEVWDTELADDEVTQLQDDVYMSKIQTEHVELQAFMTARYGNSLYRPDQLADRLKIPEHHVYAFLALNGRTGKGLY